MQNTIGARTLHRQRNLEVEWVLKNRSHKSQIYLDQVNRMDSFLLGPTVTGSLLQLLSTDFTSELCWCKGMCAHQQYSALCAHGGMPGTVHNALRVSINFPSLNKANLGSASEPPLPLPVQMLNPPQSLLFRALQSVHPSFQRPHEINLLSIPLMKECTRAY